MHLSRWLAKVMSRIGLGHWWVALCKTINILKYYVAEIMTRETFEVIIPDRFLSWKPERPCVTSVAINSS